MLYIAVYRKNRHSSGGAEAFVYTESASLSGATSVEEATKLFMKKHRSDGCEIVGWEIYEATNMKIISQDDLDKHIERVKSEAKQKLEDEFKKKHNIKDTIKAPLKKEKEEIKVDVKDDETFNLDNTVGEKPKKKTRKKKS